MSGPVRALYVHVPFCHTICGYCDFYSVVYDRKAIAPLVDALLTELELVRAHHDLAIETIFVGGGTPTTLPPQQLARLLTALRAAITSDDPEFTVEANPATVSPEIARVLADGGVNRVSIGAQSFNASELVVLERIHKPAQVAQTLESIRAAGIEHLNLDLIFAIPGQSLDSWRRNLRSAIELGVEHLSCYALTYEPETPLFERLQSGRVHPCDNSLEADMYEATIDDLAAAGFEHYEISNFARPGRRCRHNLIYWRNEHYVGIGPAAAGFVEGRRSKNAPDLAAYVRAIEAGQSACVESEQRDRDGQARETMMLGLRLIHGVEHSRFSARFGVPPRKAFAAAVAQHERSGLLRVDEHSIRLSRRGLLLADTVIADFL